MHLQLNEKSQKALQYMDQTKDHVFLTGRAGTGKSTLLTHYRSITKKQIIVLAPTGVAAVNVDGETVHSFFTFKPGITVDEARKKGRKLTDEKRKLYVRVDTIVIDEISMVRADLLDAVDAFLREAMKTTEPFGGKQMIFIGDLYQLPPVVKSEEREIFESHYHTPYFFGAEVMKRVLKNMKQHKLHYIELEEIYRQKDPIFIDLLNAVRDKKLANGQLAKLNERVMEGKAILEDAIYLTSTNAQADEINKARLEELPNENVSFFAEVKGKIDKSMFPVKECLDINIGARVMLSNNDQGGRWVNGTLGWVTDVDEYEEEITVALDSGEKVIVYTHMWEVSHTRLDEESGQLQREKVGSFKQFPLTLAWAMTIHKSQGKTFDKVIVDLGRGAFAEGQTYVALSRCTSFEGLILRRPLKTSDVRTSLHVQQFQEDMKMAAVGNYQTKEDKIQALEDAILYNQPVQLVYRSGNDKQTEHLIHPKALGTMEYKGYEYLGLRAIIDGTSYERSFSVKRIVEVRGEL